MDRIKLAFDEAGKAIPRHITKALVGSTYVRDGNDSDIDILVLVRKFEELPLPWTEGGSGGSAGGGFRSWKMEKDGETINVLQVDSLEYYISWKQAAEVCRFLYLRGFTVPTAVVHGIHGIIMDAASAEEEDLYRPR